MTSIKEILSNNNCAIVLGNGINLYFDKCSISWNALLKNLWTQNVENCEFPKEGISYTEIFDVMDIHKHEKLNLKKNIASEFGKTNNGKYENFLQYCTNKHIPILTTNYDTRLSDCIHLDLYKTSNKSNPAYYPLGYYYAFSTIAENDILNEFAIWHINGMVKYPNSIRIGLCDYAGIIEKVRKMLHSGYVNDNFKEKHQNYWNGYNTWMHIFFNKPLVFIGLQLDENEVFLRWLLLQKAMYYKKKYDYENENKGWYLYVEDKDMSKGKEIFLKYVNITPIKAADYSNLYELMK